MFLNLSSQLITEKFIYWILPPLFSVNTLFVIVPFFAFEFQFKQYTNSQNGQSAFWVVKLPDIIAHRVRHSILHRSLINISPEEVWMTPPPRVISVCIWIKARSGLICIHIILLLWLIHYCGHMLAPWPNASHNLHTSLLGWAWLFRRATCLVNFVNCDAIPLFICTSLTLVLLPLALFCWELAPNIS